MTDCGTCKRLGDKNSLVYETRYWKISLTDDQAYLGRCSVNLKRHCGDLADLKPDEQKDLFKVVKLLEGALRDAFGAVMFNWTCLMNNAYKAKIPKPHVHWHFRPRYDKKVKFTGIVFEDLEFAHHYSRERKLEVSSDVKKKIIEMISENLKVRAK
jgi:diadenosine tetraphosphate (Ap4A) HIT family hydrolase